VEAHALDVTDEAAVVSMFAAAPRVDILVNNAGVYGPVKKFINMDRAEWDRTFTVNFTSVMLCSREAVKKMAAQRSGNIINIASNVARRGQGRFGGGRGLAPVRAHEALQRAGRGRQRGGLPGQQHVERHDGPEHQRHLRIPDELTMIVDAHAHIFSHPCPSLTPPEIDDGRFPVDRRLALLDREGVDKAVIVQNPAICAVNEEVAAAVEALRRFAGCEGMRALKTEMSEGWGWTGIHPGLRLLDEAFAPLWRIVDELA
jgi:NAD(P)-dependent dehydrogenase (short-subunit alcohol dehydrogenase family)